MEEKDEKLEIPELKVKRRVSIFRRRKKSDIRPYVVETRQKKFKKFLLRLLKITGIIFLLVFILLALRIFVIPLIFEVKDREIVKPVEYKRIDIGSIEKDIENSGLDIADVKISKDFEYVTFRLHRETEVYLTTQKNIPEQLLLLRAIDNQMIEENKRAIYVDLRYNKPIVKMQ